MQTWVKFALVVKAMLLTLMQIPQAAPQGGPVFICATVLLAGLVAAVGIFGFPAGASSGTAGAGEQLEQPPLKKTGTG